MSDIQDPNKPLTRKEYEARHKALQDKYETFSRRTMRVLAVIVLGLFLVAGAATYLLNENGNRVDEASTLSKQSAELSVEIRESIIKSCETSGNSLRAATRKFGQALVNQITDQLQQSDIFAESGFYDELFPNLSEDRLSQLLAESRVRDLKTVADIRDGIADIGAVDCQARFGSSSGEN